MAKPKQREASNKVVTIGGAEAPVGEANLALGQVSDESNLTAPPVFKVRFPVKVIAFCASVITLSWFFEGWRKIHEGLNPSSIGILSAGTLLTLALLAVQSFWIYADEKQKGSLVRRIALFDRILEKLLARRAPAQAINPPLDGALRKGNKHV